MTAITPELTDLPAAAGELMQAVRELDDDTLDLLQAEAEQKLDAIKLKLAEARANRAELGIYADRDWYHRAQLAERITKRQHQHLLRERGRRRRERSQAQQSQRQTDYAACLLSAMDALVPRELRREVIESANRMHEDRVARG